MLAYVCSPSQLFHAVPKHLLLRPSLVCAHIALASTACLPPLHTSLPPTTMHALLFAVVKCSICAVAAQWRKMERENMTVTLQTLRLLSAERNGCIGHVHGALPCLCLCMSKHTIPKYTSSNSAGARMCTVQSAHTSQTNWTLQVKCAWARYGLSSVNDVYMRRHI